MIEQKMEQRKQVLSAIQPTGYMHFGNYFGAVKNWVKLQEKYDCVYGVVDYHAMTMPYNPKKLRENTWELIFNLIAVGVQPNNLFIQSLIPEHAELCWILNCFTSYGQLTRMTQFKDKSGQSKEASDDFVSAGLLDYPVLQAADILIYRADYVPVGKDQEQHLELTRNIAQRFNNQVGKEYFVLPESLYTEVPKVRSTADPTRKMSKSAGPKHYINVFEEEGRLRKQIRSAVTDTGTAEEGVMSEGVANLFELLKAAEHHDAHQQLMDDYNAGNLKYVALKDAVADALVGLSNQFRERKEAIKSNKKEVKNQVKASSADIRKQAQQTVKEVKELAGLSNVKF
jgi:tryptophanyl-tRNA synthetase